MQRPLYYFYFAVTHELTPMEQIVMTPSTTSLEAKKNMTH